MSREERRARYGLIVQDYLSGMSVPDIAFKYRLHQTRIRQILGDHETSLRPRQHNPRKLTAEQVRFIRASNLSGRELGEMFGINRNHANDIKRGSRCLMVA